MQATIVQSANFACKEEYKTSPQFYPIALRNLAFLGLTGISEITSTSNPKHVDIKIADTADGIDGLLEMLSKRDVVNSKTLRGGYVFPDGRTDVLGHIRFMANTSPESPIGNQQVIISLAPNWYARATRGKPEEQAPLDLLEDIVITCHYTSGAEAVKGLYGLEQTGSFRLSEELLLHDFPEEVSQTWKRLGGHISFYQPDEEDGYTNFKRLNEEVEQSKLQTASMAKIILAEVAKLGITPKSIMEWGDDGIPHMATGGKIREFEQLIHATQYFHRVPLFSASYAKAPESELILQTALGSQELKIDGIIDIRNGLVTVTSQAENPHDRIRTLASLLDDCNQRLLTTGAAYTS